MKNKRQRSRDRGPSRRLFGHFQKLEDRLLLAGDIQLVRDLNPGPASIAPLHLVDFKGSLYFEGNDSVSGYELWKSDGTAAGTELVKDLVPGFESSDPVGFTLFGDKIFFTAGDSVHGREPWVSDGTAAGTTLLKDIWGGTGSGNPNARLAIGNTVFFAASTSATGEELWITNGTEGSTTLVKDIRPANFGSSLRAFTEFKGVLFFAANNGTNALELWKSDGTTAGTSMVKDVNPGGGFGNPQFLTAVGDTLFFGASNGVDGEELWKTDGTAAGTTLVKDVYPGSSGSLPRSLISFQGKLYFVANSPGLNRELWVSDGTPGGTYMLKDINPGAASGLFDSPIVINDTLYFIGDDGEHGAELWRTDGSAAGTVMVKDIKQGSGSPGLTAFTNVDGQLYFAADDGINGRELWKSDGTALGTVMVSDITGDGASSNPSNLTWVQNKLFFNATRSDVGTELFALPLQELPNSPPTLSKVGNISIDEETMISFVVSASDPDVPQQILSFSLDVNALALGMYIDPVTGVYSWTPTEVQGPASFTFDVVVSDGSLTDSETVTVTVGEVNQAPVVVAIGNLWVDEGAELAFRAFATDVDVPVQMLTFSLSGAIPPGANIDSITGAFSWTPSEMQGPGSFTFDVVVSDGSLADSETITVTVAEVNAAPVALDDLYVAKEDHLLTVSAPGVLGNDSDPNGDDVVAVLQDNVSHGLLYFQNDGSFTYLPDADWSGFDSFTYAAHDGFSISNFVTVTITVQSSQGQLESLVNIVQDLVASDFLNQGNGNALISKLESALNKITAGKLQPAVNNLNAFIHQVSVFISDGKLSAEQGQSLIEAATTAIESANLSGSSALLLESTTNAEEMGSAEPLRLVDELVTGTVWVSFDDPLSVTLPAHRARLDDAISSLNTTFGMHGLTLGAIDASSETIANVRIVIAGNSACGGVSDGVLGCATTGEVTLIAGWNWYTDIGEGGIVSGEYDFQTILTHELGHALGLDHSADNFSVMHYFLSDATLQRTVTDRDLLLLRQDNSEPDGPPSALLASSRHEASSDPIFTTDFAVPSPFEFLVIGWTRILADFDADDDLAFFQSFDVTQISSDLLVQPLLHSADHTASRYSAEIEARDQSLEVDGSGKAVDEVFDLDEDWLVFATTSH